MEIVGITGGIASGKTTVSNVLKDLGAIIIDADIIARRVVERGKPALERIKKEFGSEIIKSNGELDRERLGKIVFSDAGQLNKLNNITHEPIIDEILNEINLYKKYKKHKFIFIDAALLIEMNMVRLVDELWLVAVDHDVQIKRLMQRDGLSREEAFSRIKTQMSLDDKKKYATVIIDNNKDLEYLKGQVIKEFDRLLGGI